MIVRTNLRAGQSELNLNTLAQQIAGQQQLAGLANQALGKFDPHTVNALVQIASGSTGPQQFLSMVGK